jgi:uncharacterized protein (UPF0332 family)
MSTSSEDYISYRIKKSAESFADAKLLAENKRWNAAVNRLYYSCFYAVSALIYQKGLRAETHTGAKTQLNLNFVKTGLVSVEHGKLYANLFDWRQESDYADFIDFDEETVTMLLPRVENLVNSLMQLIKS